MYVYYIVYICVFLHVESGSALSAAKGFARCGLHRVRQIRTPSGALLAQQYHLYHGKADWSP